MLRLLNTIAAAHNPSSSHTWWTTSSSEKVFLHDQPPLRLTQAVDVKAQAGEIEAFQIHLFNAHDDVLPAAPVLEPDDNDLIMSWRKVVHIWCNKSSIYPSGSETGFQPDVLVDPSYFKNGTGIRVPLEAGVVHSLWIRLHVSRTAVVGQRNLRLSVKTDAAAVEVPISLTVWPIVLPTLSGSFGSIFTLFYRSDRSGANQLSKYYGPGPLAPAMKRKYFDLLCENHIPADNLYITDPRPMEDYKLLGEVCGAPRFNLLDVQAVAGPFTNSSMLYTHAQIDKTLDALAPLVDGVAALGLLRRAYVYGFDERPRSYTRAIRQLFGAIKAAYPLLRTVAVLRWAPSDDMHIDTWVNLYSLWNASEAAAFRASAPGRREAWAYHCISPRPPGDPPTGPVRYLNTFVEYPAIDPRLLPWLGVLEGADGWLYYLVDGWEGKDAGAAPKPLRHAPLTLLPGSSTRTNFSAVRYNGAAVKSDPQAFSNGDGILIYPGVGGPLASARLERLRDGFEDAELLRAAGVGGATGQPASTAIARTVVHSFVREGLPGAGVNVTDDPATLEKAREALAVQIGSAAAIRDPRDVASGVVISAAGGYQDQPQVVVDGNDHRSWSVVLTANSVREGQGSQSVVSTVSTDGGRSFGPLVDIEPHVAPRGLTPRSAGWVNNLRVPATGRVFAFYTFNAENVTTDPHVPPAVHNFNLLGSWVYRYSDDNGRSWSKARFNMSRGAGGGVYRETQIDRTNSWKGAVREGWSVGKPLVADDGRTVLMQFSKVSTLAQRSEGFFLRSTNVLEPTTAAEDVAFELVPRADVGLRATSGTIAEEGGVVQLQGSGAFYAVYRTESGFLNVATSADGISWRDRQFAYYDTADYADGFYETRLKQPRGPITPRRFSNGRFLLTVHLNSDTPGWNDRDPYFLVAGTEQNGTVLWSQPEVALYIVPPCADKRCGIGYPDFVETGSAATASDKDSSRHRSGRAEPAWQIYLTETDKVRSRVHALNMSLLDRMWSQTTVSEVASGAAASWARGASQPFKAPELGNLSAGGALSIELGFNGAALAAAPSPLLDCRDVHGHGVAVLAGQSGGRAVLNLTFCDTASRCQAWHTDAEASFETKGERAHAMFIVDGRARLIMSVSNGKWADGGSVRPKGFTHLGGGIAGNGGIGVVDGSKSCTVREEAVHMVRVYGRALSVSESIGNWRHGRSSLRSNDEDDGR